MADNKEHTTSRDQLAGTIPMCLYWRILRTLDVFIIIIPFSLVLFGKMSKIIEPRLLLIGTIQLQKL